MDSTTAAASESEKKKKKRKKRKAEATMEFVSTADSLGNPYVAYFPSGFDPLQNPHGDDGRPLTKFVPYRNPKPLSRQRELTALRETGADFVGFNYRGEAAGWQPCDYLLGVLDKEKGSLRLMPLAGEKVFRMEARAKGVEYGRPADEETAAEEGTAAEAKASQRMLTEAFGSKRMRLKDARYDRAQVKEAKGEFSGIKSLFNEAARTNELLAAEQIVENGNVEIVRNIPPHDAAATTPQTAFLLDKMIAPEEWAALAEDANALKAAALAAGPAQSRSQDAYPSFVQRRLERLKVEGDADGNERRAHILAYVKHLLKLHFAPAWLVRKAADPWDAATASEAGNLAQELGVPGPLVAKFLETFTTTTARSAQDGGGCRRSKEDMQLAISYVLVLGLMIDDFVADPYDIATDLRMTVTEVRPHFQQLGCKFEKRRAAEKLKAGEPSESARLKWKVTLPVPLRFPQLSNNFNRRR